MTKTVLVYALCTMQTHLIQVFFNTFNCSFMREDVTELSIPTTLFTIYLPRVSPLVVISLSALKSPLPVCIEALRQLTWGKGLLRLTQELWRIANFGIIIYFLQCKFLARPLSNLVWPQSWSCSEWEAGLELSCGLFKPELSCDLMIPLSPHLLWLHHWGLPKVHVLILLQSKDKTSLFPCLGNRAPKSASFSLLFHPLSPQAGVHALLLCSYSICHLFG